MTVKEWSLLSMVEEKIEEDLRRETDRMKLP